MNPQRPIRRKRPPTGPTSGRRGHKDERGSIVLALSVIILAAGLLSVTATTAYTQLFLTNQNVQRTDALEAAQAGLDAAVGNLRGAVDAGGAGDVAKLPCNAIDGVVNTSSSAQYSATVTYFDADPIGQTSGSAWWNNNIIGCNGATGTAPNTPSYALISSTGKDINGPSRTLIETYIFDTTVVHVSGGEIENYGLTVCMQAPSSGTQLQVAPCSGARAQQFAFRSDSTIVWTNSITVANPAGLCLTAGTTAHDANNGSAGDASGNPINLATCTDGANQSQTPDDSQQWGVNDSGGLQTVNSAGDPASGNLCMTISGTVVQLAGCGGFSDNGTWFLQASVGAGVAGPQSEQLVNYQEFGDCLDVTGANTGSAYLIDYMCKQFPDTARYPIWNQRFVYTNHELQTNTNFPAPPTPSSLYCLTSPLSTAGLAYVTVTPCATAPLNAITWTEKGLTSSAATSYTITDAQGYCLEADTARPVYPSSDAFSPITVAACNGSYEQKWNGTAADIGGTVIDTYEQGES
jgi:hypothetical protein